MTSQFIKMRTQSTCAALSGLAVIVSLFLIGGANAAIILAAAVTSIFAGAAVLYGISRLISGPFDSSTPLADRILPGVLFSTLISMPIMGWITAFSGSIEVKGGGVFAGFSGDHFVGGIACLLAAAVCTVCFARKFSWENNRQIRAMGLAFGSVFSSLVILPLALISINLAS